MKNWYLLFLILFFMTSSAFAVPDNIQVGKPEFIIYDSSYNLKLRNKLEDDYTKKYVKQINKNYSVDTSPLGAYGREVLVPYALNKKTKNYKIRKIY